MPHTSLVLLVAAVVVVSWSTPVRGQPLSAPIHSVGNPPAIGKATLDENDVLSVDFQACGGVFALPQRVEQSFTMMVPVVEEYEEDGAKKTRTRMEPQARTRTIAVMRQVTAASWDVAKCRLLDPNGDELSPMQTFDRLKAGIPVVVVPEGTELPDLYRQVLREDTVVIVVPPMDASSVAGVLPAPIAPPILPAPIAPPMVVPAVPVEGEDDRKDRDDGDNDDKDGDGDNI